MSGQPNHQRYDSAATLVVDLDTESRNGALSPKSAAQQNDRRRAGRHSFSHSIKAQAINSSIITDIPTTPSEYDPPTLPSEERGRLLREQQDLLRDSHLLPARNRSSSSSSETPAYERVPLMEHLEMGMSQDEATISDLWEHAVLEGKVRTSYARELKVLVQYSAPLTFTYLLQSSILTSSVVTVGHMGTTELAGISLGIMTAAVTGISVFRGFVAALDTLCSQAYGAGKKTLVGVHLQRMWCLLFFISIPIAVFWWYIEPVLNMIVDDREITHLAAMYLRVMILAMPGMHLWESGRRFLQAQGIFNVNMWCLMIFAPINMLLHYLLVWHWGLGFIGAPLSVSITYTCLPIFLFCYVAFVGGSECWGGFSKAAFTNWGTMLRIAIADLVMVTAEWLAWEFVTLMSARFGVEAMAARTIAWSWISTMFAAGFSLSVASSTRIGNLIGASLVEPAKKAMLMSFYLSCVLGGVAALMTVLVRNQFPYWYTSDEKVVGLLRDSLITMLALIFFDATSSACNGISRGLGRQDLGAWVGVFSYYVVGVPLSLLMAFTLGFGLDGLWIGLTTADILIMVILGYFIITLDLQQVVEAARRRNDLG